MLSTVPMASVEHRMKVLKKGFGTVDKNADTETAMSQMEA